MTFQLTCPRAYLFSNRGMTPNNAVGVEEVITMEYTELEDAGRNIGIVSLWQMPELLRKLVDNSVVVRLEEMLVHKEGNAEEPEGKKSSRN